MIARRFRELALSATTALVLSACTTEAEIELVGSHPPIPSLAESGQCGSWGCTVGQCGYDPATDPRGACCTGPVLPGGSAQPKPSCGNRPFCMQYPSICQSQQGGSGYCQGSAGNPGSYYCDPYCSPGGWDPCVCSLYAPYHPECQV